MLLQCSVTTSLLVSLCCFDASGAMVVLADVPTLRSVIEYDDLLNRLVAAGTPVATDNANDCLNGRGLGFSIPDGKRSVSCRHTNAYMHLICIYVYMYLLCIYVYYVFYMHIYVSYMHICILYI